MSDEELDYILGALRAEKRRRKYRRKA